MKIYRWDKAIGIIEKGFEFYLRFLTKLVVIAFFYLPAFQSLNFVHFY